MADRHDQPAASPSRPDPTFEELSATIAGYDDPDDKLTIALGNFNRVRRERDRLREALTYYAEGRYPDGGEIAREALNG